MKLHHVLSATAIVAVCAAPAHAGEEVLYETKPDWVAPVDFEAALEERGTFVLFDRQVRMEDGVVHDYFDYAIKIETPQALTQLGTVQVPWLPDKGDLFIHGMQIVRDGEVIDLIAQGVTFDVLRREQQLEQRSLDGMLTATVAVPGLRVGDVLRVVRSTTKRDQALDGEMQVLQGVFAEPTQIGYGRTIISWPENLDVRYQVTRDVALREPVLEDGYRVLTLEYPVDELPEMPADAPSRFTQDALLQAGTYDGWQDVSAKMAEHFTTEDAVQPGGEVAAEIASIERKSDKPLERAALALQVVQDRIAYLLNGLDGGNYLPQSPEQTWELRYGDCKAKSMLLLAMLREMGIDSEAVLVRTQAGDWVNELLPMPGDFDHMIVRATIDGEDYWLDGTSAGTRLATIGEVPGFSYALPLREGGADLIPMEQRWQTAPDRVVKVTFDQRAGFDFPNLFEAQVELQGLSAAQLQQAAEEDKGAKVVEIASNYMQNIVGDNIVYDASVDFDEDSGVAVVSAKGLTDSWWQFERERATLTPWTSSNDMEFSPDRARRDWRDIPFQVGGPLQSQEEFTFYLPDSAVSFDLRGTDVSDQVVAGAKVTRSATLNDGMLRVSSDMATIPVEIPASEFAEQRRAASRLNSGDYVVRVNDGAKRYWEYSESEAQERLAPMGRALDAFVAIDPTEAWRHALRASLRRFTYDYAGAIADLDAAIAEEPTAELIRLRADAYANEGDWERAIDDARYAYELEGDAANAVTLAGYLAETGEVEEALDLLEEFDLGGDERIGLLQIRAEYEGFAGRAEKGWNLLEEAMAERPGDSTLLNSQCWHMGSFKFRLDQAEDVCSEAVQASQYEANVLDSRALAYFRLGDNEKALRDIEAALKSQPELAASRFLKGLILIEQGQAAEGRKEIAYAKRIAPRVEEQYARYGLSVPQ